ncbi:polymer-forming cytoskeletal protein [Nitrospira sp. M1]
MKQIALLHGRPSRLKGTIYPIRRISRIAQEPKPVRAKTQEPGEWREDNPSAFLGPGGECKGVMTGDGKMRIDGNLEGEIHTQGSVIVGEEGMVEADIQADSIVTQGVITGNVKAKKSMHLKSSAVVKGAVTTPFLSMEEGAVLETDWSLWINGGRIPGNVWNEMFQHEAITHPPWWPSEVPEFSIREG